MGCRVGRMGEVLATDMSLRLGNCLSQRSVDVSILVCSSAATVSGGCRGIGRVMGCVLSSLVYIWLWIGQMGLPYS